MTFQTIFHNFGAWLALQYDAAPAIMIGITLVFTVLLLAMISWLIRYMMSGTSKSEEIVLRSIPISGWKARGLLIVADEAGKSHNIDFGLLRIGREADNDVQLMYDTVHRYHAILERTPEAEFYILDVSGCDGNGVRVDGERIQRARLRGGELIEIGPAKLQFQLADTA